MLADLKSKFLSINFFDLLTVDLSLISVVGVCFYVGLRWHGYVHRAESFSTCRNYPR